MSSIFECSDINNDKWFAIHLNRGAQYAESFNNSLCKSQNHPTITNDWPTVCIMSYSYIFGNEAKSTIYYGNINVFISHTNFIKNKESTNGVNYYGLISTHDNKNLTVDSCCIFDNDVTYLSFSTHGKVYFIRCSLDNQKANNAEFALCSNNKFPEIPLTMYGSQKILAKFPYASKRKSCRLRKNRNSIVFLSFLNCFCVFF